MGMISRFIGPKSKYDDTLPYTYEARVPILDNEDDYNSYMCDTICGLIRYLKEHDVTPEEATIYEIYKQDEKVIAIDLCTNEDGQWLKKSAICKSFQKHYKGHIFNGDCSFRDRESDGTGP